MFDLLQFDSLPGRIAKDNIEARSFASEYERELNLPLEEPVSVRAQPHGSLHFVQRRVVTFREAPRTEPYGKVAVFEDLYGQGWDLIGLKRGG